VHLQLKCGKPLPPNNFICIQSRIRLGRAMPSLKRQVGVFIVMLVKILWWCRIYLCAVVWQVDEYLDHQDELAKMQA
jgi:hypothetical protein